MIAVAAFNRRATCPFLSDHATAVRPGRVAVRLSLSCDRRAVPHDPVVPYRRALAVGRTKPRLRCEAVLAAGSATARVRRAEVRDARIRPRRDLPRRHDGPGPQGRWPQPPSDRPTAA